MNIYKVNIKLTIYNNKKILIKIYHNGNLYILFYLKLILIELSRNI